MLAPAASGPVCVTPEDMMTHANETPSKSKAKVDLVRTKKDTATWAVRAAFTPHPSSPSERHRNDTAEKVVLTRTPRETLRWTLRATPWGAATVVGTLMIAAAALIGLWFAVPLIDAAVAGAEAAGADVIAWVWDQIAAFPGWLGSLFSGPTPPES